MTLQLLLYTERFKSFFLDLAAEVQNFLTLKILLNWLPHFQNLI